MRSAFLSGIVLLWVSGLGGCAPEALTALPMETALPATATARLPALIDPASSWIEVDLANQTVILHEGGAAAATLAASTGVTSDPKYATPPGLYQVQSMDKGPVESVPGVFVTDVIMFDLGKGNGFHSRPMDAEGNILDETLGEPSTAGCVRVGESVRLFEFAKVGMKVWIH